MRKGITNNKFGYFRLLLRLNQHEMKLNYRTYYDKFADRYLEMQKAGLFYFHDKIQMPAITVMLEGKRFKNTLDIGCGTGYYTRIFSDFSDDVVGLDISQSMIKIAKKENPRSNIEYLESDVLSYRSPQKFDFLF